MSLKNPDPQEVLASVDDHLQAANGLDEALKPLGFLVAFAFHHGLLSTAFMSEHADIASRMRLQEGRVSELFARHGGTLRRQDLTPSGQAFIHKYLPFYMQDFVQTFADEGYAVKDSWDNYQRLAKVLIRRLRGAPNPGLVNSKTGIGGAISKLGSLLGRLWQ